jgi:nucleotide-binding universal stress UspA family protein
VPLAKILLATDGSPEAASAARMAITLSRSLGGELHVVYVGVAPSAYAAAESEILDYEFWKELREIAQNEASKSVEEEVRKIEDTGVKVEMVHVAVGHPESEILRIAEEIGADLVVVGSRGHGPLRRALMGSVSESVVRHAHCSVLVVRGQERHAGYLPGRVLLALDGSRRANRAERSAAEISAATGSVLDIVRVLEAERYRPYPGPEYWEGWEADLERSKRQVGAFLDARARNLRDEGVEVGDAHLALGDPDKEIVRFAEDAQADLIVLGSRGFGRLRRALLGSVSDSVVRHAHCPVLVVRQEPTHEFLLRPNAQFGQGTKSEESVQP